MEIAELLLKYLSWPVVALVVFLLIRRKLVGLIPHVRRVEILGSKLELVESSVGLQKEKLGSQEKNLKDQADRIAKQESIICQLVVFSMSSHIFEHLKSLYYKAGTGETHIYRKDAFYNRDLYFLRDNGYIEAIGPGLLDIDRLCDGIDLTKVAKPTPIGRFYVELRESLERSAKKNVTVKKRPNQAVEPTEE